MSGIMRIGLKHAGLVVLAAIAAAPAAAQTTSNEVWLGQVGGLNAVDILQEGSGNRAGADSTYLLLNQDGTGNALTLSQIGYNNTLGTLFGDVPDYARGVWQRGDRNVVEITQYNVALDGANTIGAIQQLNAYSLPVNSDAFNAIVILQTSDTAAPGSAGIISAGWSRKSPVTTRSVPISFPSSSRMVVTHRATALPTCARPVAATSLSPCRRGSCK